MFNLDSPAQWRDRSKAERKYRLEDTLARMNTLLNAIAEEGEEKMLEGRARMQRRTHLS